MLEYLCIAKFVLESGSLFGEEEEADEADEGCDQCRTENTAHSSTNGG